MSETETKRKLTDSQLRVIQVAAGIIASIALLAALFIAGPNAGDNVLLQYLWIIIFAVVMFGRRWVERRFNMRLALYNLAMLDTLAILIVIYASILFFAPGVLGAEELAMSMPVKLLIVIGVGLLVIIFGIILPISRYFKRKEEGTLRPIRLPDPEEITVEEEEEAKDEDPSLAGLSPLERQIMEMTKDLDNKDEEENK